MQNIEIQFTLDELDLISSCVEALQQNLNDADDDKPVVDAVMEKLVDFTDKVGAMAEYMTGNDFPENLVTHLTCSEEDIKKSLEQQ